MSISLNVSVEYFVAEQNSYNLPPILLFGEAVWLCQLVWMVSSNSIFKFLFFGF